MKNTTTVQSAFFSPYILLGLTLFSSLFSVIDKPTRQYSPDANVKAKIKKQAESKAQFFFNARKNPATDSLDYAAMLKTDQQIEKARLSHHATGAINLNWKALGPDNYGGETRAILVDKNDKTGQTIFAGAICGGLWKSTNGGATWDSTATTIANGCVTCIAQDSNGNIFIGTGNGFEVSGYPTGDGFSCGQLGGGIFESKDDGATFTFLTATTPNISNSTTATWAYTNRIAILPTNPQVIYASTDDGLMVSTNGGASFNVAMSGTVKLYGNSLDVKASNDGKIVVACCNGNAYYAYPSVSTTNFTLFRQTGHDSLPSSGGGRIELAIAPSNSNYLYASVIGPFDACLGVYLNMTAVSSGNGGKWYELGDSTFNIYSTGIQGQGTYDNAIGISPTNPGKAFFGGVTIWKWEQTSASDTVGSWSNVTTYYSYGLGDPNYVHPEIHAIVFDPVHNNNVYVGCDGGVYKSTNGASTFQQEDQYYYSTEFYSIAIAPNMNANGEGVMGGTEDNGSLYINGNFPNYQDADQIEGGNAGGQCAISILDPNIFYVTGQLNSLLRSNGLNYLSAPVNAYTYTQGLNEGADIDSVSNQGTGCYVTPLALYENGYDTATLDSMTWVADKSYNAGDTVYPISPNGNFAFPYILTSPISSGVGIHVQNRVVSKIATAFSPSNGVWMMMQATNFSILPIWMPIGGPLSKPDAFTTKSSQPVHCMAWSPNGDVLFVGTEDGQLYRFSNLDSIIDTSYTTGALYSMPYGHIRVINNLTRVVSTSLTTALNDPGDDILSISIDPKNGNRMIVTTGDYVSGTHVYYCNNALATSGVSFQSAQGNLPEMPVYGSIIDIINSPYPNGAILATEHGVYTTTDVTVASPSWSVNNNGTTNTIAIAIKQQTAAPWNCNNSGKIYIATNGRGLYVDSSYYIPTGINEINAATSLKVNLSIYPNPMNSGGTIVFTLPVAGKAGITIYDIQGRMMKEIPITNQGPGQHTVTFNSQDMPVGTYIAVLSGNNFRQSKRFVVVR